eukprot:7974973-Lingulodinium_polyedra.AAC.1
MPRLRGVRPSPGPRLAPQAPPWRPSRHCGAVSIGGSFVCALLQIGRRFCFRPAQRLLAGRPRQLRCSEGGARPAP